MANRFDLLLHTLSGYKKNGATLRGSHCTCKRFLPLPHNRLFANAFEVVISLGEVFAAEEAAVGG